MKRSTFKPFIEAVRTGAPNNPVFYAGYLWLQLTEKQYAETVNALILRGDCEVKKHNDKWLILAPSGYGLALDAEHMKKLEVLNNV